MLSQMTTSFFLMLHNIPLHIYTTFLYLFIIDKYLGYNFSRKILVALWEFSQSRKNFFVHFLLDLTIAIVLV